MLKKLILITLGMALALSACGSPKSANGSTGLTKIRLPMGYVPNIQFAPWYVAVQKGYFRQAGIEIDFDYSFETDGVKLVGAGEIPFSIVSGDQVLIAREQGLPVTYIAAWYQQYPVSVVARSPLGILIPQDLKGKKIGLPGKFGASYIGLRALLSAGKMSESDVTLDSIGFNQSTPYISSLDGNLTPANYFYSGRPFPDGVLAPAGTPKPIIDKLYQSMAEALKDPAIRNNFIEQGAEPVSPGPEELQKFIVSETQKWRKIIHQAGIQPM